LTGPGRRGVDPALKAMILGALDDCGGRAYLASLAASHPGPFLTLFGKVLEKDERQTGRGAATITVTIASEPGSAPEAG